MKNKEYSRSVRENFASFKDVKKVYTINTGWHEIAQGCMGWRTKCNKYVVSDELFGMKTYIVYWTDLISLS